MRTKEGLWRLSPSGLYTFSECPACFWVDNHYKRAPMLPLLLNSAMDSILKSRYDRYREKNTFPPEAKELEREGIRPFTDLKKLNDWRENLNALKIINKTAGYELVGKIDDVLTEPDGRLIPADYKSSGNAPAEDKQKYYRDQLAAYGLMFKNQGHEVSDRAFLFHYFVKDKNNPSLEVEFDSHVDPVRVDLAGIEEKLSLMVKFLNGPYPGPGEVCEKCSYHNGRGELLKK